jgi:hypothetical protein
MPEIAPPFENWLMRTAWIWSVGITRSYVMSNAIRDQWIECFLICILDCYVTVTWKFKGQKRMVKLGVFLYTTSLDSVFLLYQKLKSSVREKNWHWISIRKKKKIYLTGLVLSANKSFDELTNNILTFFLVV